MRGCALSKISPQREGTESLCTVTSQAPFCHWTCDKGNAWPNHQGLPNEEAK